MQNSYRFFLLSALLLFLGCQKSQPAAAGLLTLNLSVQAGIITASQETGFFPNGYVFLDAPGFRDSSLVALLQNYRAQVHAPPCVLEILDEASFVEVLLDTRIVFSMAMGESVSPEDSFLFHIGGVDLAQLPSCQMLGNAPNLKIWRANDGSWLMAWGRFAQSITPGKGFLGQGKWPFPQHKNALVIWGADSRADMLLAISVENGLNIKTKIVFHKETMAQWVEKNVRQFRRQLESFKQTKQLAKHIRYEREAQDFRMELAWSRHDIRQFLQAISPKAPPNPPARQNQPQRQR